MIGVRGSGCSMPITDATASASDIVSGKVAYGNNGRIVGTHTESKITDATASAKDIVSGKVAYNNYGRVTGTLDTSNLFKSVNITIQRGEYSWTDRDDDVFIYYGKKDMLHILNQKIPMEFNLKISLIWHNVQIGLIIHH